MNAHIKCECFSIICSPISQSPTGQCARVSLCVSLLSKVINGALNFELLTNNCCVIYTNNYICQIKIARVNAALIFAVTLYYRGLEIYVTLTVTLVTNLVPRVHWLFGQREGASRDSGIMEKIYFFDWLIIKQRNGEPETYDNKTGSLRPN